MVRKLRTFVTSIGFFDLAVAAPSMKAALEAWGVERNLFHSGFAEESSDPKIVAATMGKPGVVLRRAVGSTGLFTEHADLPKTLPSTGKQEARPLPTKERAKKGTPKTPRVDEKKQKAAIIEFARAKARRDRERAQDEAEREKREERDARDSEKRRKVVEKAEAVLKRAKERHEIKMDEIDRARQAAEESEKQRWQKEKAKLEADVRQAGR